MPVPFDEVNCEERPEEVRKQMRDIWGKSVAGRRYSNKKSPRDRSRHDLIKE